MTNADAVLTLSALAQINRLEIFRLLVSREPHGMTAGEISETCGLSATRCSFHLKELERAGVLNMTREGRFIRYRVCIAEVRDLLTFLTRDCCGGRPELCAADGVFHAPESRNQKVELAVSRGECEPGTGFTN
ncbi:MAG: metalloregulator ArsR/SmtB family transcription factor [Pseudomonadota bacterium]